MYALESSNYNNMIATIKDGLDIKNFPANPSHIKSNLEEQKNQCELFYLQIKELLPPEDNQISKELASLLARLFFIYGKQFCYAKLENGEGFRRAARLHELAIVQLLRSHGNVSLPAIRWKNEASFDSFVSTLGKIAPPDRSPITAALDAFVLEHADHPASQLKMMQLPDEELKVLHDSFRQLAYSQQNIPGMLPPMQCSSAQQTDEEKIKWNFMQKVHRAYEAFALASISLKPVSEETSEDTCERAEILYNRAIVQPRFNEGGAFDQSERRCGIEQLCPSPHRGAQGLQRG